ncbi:TPA: hypothetical protein I9092_003252 [Clostridium perfringens]|nr:hypothetical protein [Clostridium perfringens]
MAKPREIRITFKEKEADLYDYIQEKSSASAFLKDLAKLEKKKEEIYLNNLTSSDISDKILSSQKTNFIEYKEKEETLVLPDISDLED